MKKIWRLFTALLAFVVIFAFIGSKSFSCANNNNNNNGGGTVVVPDIGSEGFY